MLEIGYSRTVINPPDGTLLAGFAKRRPSAGVHDNLFARAAVVRAGETFVFVQLDVLSAREEFVGLLWGLLRSRFGLPRQNLFVNCIHTHSGPMDEPPAGEGVIGGMSLETGPVAREIAAKAAACVGEARNNLCPARLGRRSARLRGIGLNRNDPAAPLDDALEVLLFTRRDGEKVVFYNYACHPTVMGPQNLLVSADYPGRAAAVLEGGAGIGCALFLNGACGDVSTRFTRRESSFAEADRIGGLLGEEVLRLAAPPVPDGFVSDEAAPVRAAARGFDIRIRPLPAPPEAQAQAEAALRAVKEARAAGLAGGELRRVQSVYEGALCNLGVIKAVGEQKSFRLEVRACRLGDTLLAYIPGELFTSLSLRLKREFPGLLVVCYGNGYRGYIPDEAAYGQGGYETLSTLFAPGEGERLAEGVGGLLRELRQRQPVA